MLEDLGALSYHSSSGVARAALAVMGELLFFASVTADNEELHSSWKLSTRLRRLLEAWAGEAAAKGTRGNSGLSTGFIALRCIENTLAQAVTSARNLATPVCPIDPHSLSLPHRPWMCDRRLRVLRVRLLFLLESLWKREHAA